MEPAEELTKLVLEEHWNELSIPVNVSSVEELDLRSIDAHALVASIRGGKPLHRDAHLHGEAEIISHSSFSPMVLPAGATYHVPRSAIATATVSHSSSPEQPQQPLSSSPAPLLLAPSPAEVNASAGASPPNPAALELPGLRDLADNGLTSDCLAECAFELWALTQCDGSSAPNVLQHLLEHFKSALGASSLTMNLFPHIARAHRLCDVPLSLLLAYSRTSSSASSPQRGRSGSRWVARQLNALAELCRGYLSMQTSDVMQLAKNEAGTSVSNLSRALDLAQQDLKHLSGSPIDPHVRLGL
jgi:hypothetical protein